MNGEPTDKTFSWPFHVLFRRAEKMKARHKFSGNKRLLISSMYHHLYCCLISSRLGLLFTQIRKRNNINKCNWLQWLHPKTIHAKKKRKGRAVEKQNKLVRIGAQRRVFFPLFVSFLYLIVWGNPFYLSQYWIHQLKRTRFSLSHETVFQW